MKPQIVLGPYLLPGKSVETTKYGVAPLGITLEWATTTESVRIPLYRYQPPHCTRHTRLEHIVLAANRLAIPIDCSCGHVVTTKHGVFVPLEALLLALYRTRQVQRPVFAVLEELSTLVQLHAAVSRPIYGSGFLNLRAEERGFRLNTVIRSSGSLVTEIVWEPPVSSYRYHVCLCLFAKGGRLDHVKWSPLNLTGVSTLLRDELLRIINGRVSDLFSPEAASILRTFINLGSDARHA